MANEPYPVTTRQIQEHIKLFDTLVEMGVSDLPPRPVERWCSKTSTWLTDWENYQWALEDWETSAAPDLIRYGARLAPLPLLEDFA